MEHDIYLTYSQYMIVGTVAGISIAVLLPFKTSWRWKLIVPLILLLVSAPAAAGFLQYWGESSVCFQLADAVTFLTLVYLAIRILVLVVVEWLLTSQMGLSVSRIFKQLGGLAAYLGLIAGAIFLFRDNANDSTVLAGGAIAGTILALALKPTLETLFSGLSLIFERHIKAGSWVVIDDLRGRVEEVGWRSILIRSRRNHRVVLPNSEAVANRIYILGTDREPMALNIDVGVSYGVPPDEAKVVLLRVASQLETVLDDPPPKIMTREFGESSILYKCRLWIDSPEKFNDVTDRFLTFAYTALCRASMEIPYPHRTLHIAPSSERETSEDPCLKTLARHDLFSQLPAGVLDALAKRSRWLRYAPGEAVFMKGEEASAVYLIGKGSVIFEHGSGETSRLGRGEILGELAFLTEKPHENTARASGAAWLVEMDRSAVSEAIEPNPEVIDALAHIAAERKEQLEGTAAPHRGKESPRPSMVERAKESIGRLFASDSSRNSDESDDS